MERHLARRQDDVHCLGVIYLDCDFLAAAQQIVGREGVLVRQLVKFMRSGDDTHASVFPRARRERDPGRHNIGFGETPISRILMPRYARPVERILNKESRTPAQNVRPEDIGNRIDDSVIAY